jgi:hypothetical protein
VTEETLIAIRWIVYGSIFSTVLWLGWDPYHPLMTFFAAGLLSFLGGAAIMLPIELAFDSEMQASPVKRALIFFAVLGFLILVFWSGGGGDYYEL